MGLCNKCLHMQKRYDEFRQAYVDTDIIGENKEQHFCPMYDDNIPNDIYYGDSKCEYFESQER